jgi:glycosyltransferase involved in cell wall biosynthesis
MSSRPLRVLWLIDHVCYDGSLHGGGRLFRNLVPEFDPARVRVFPYFLRSSEEVRRVFADAPVPVPTLGKAKYDPTALLTVWRLCRRHSIDVLHLFCYASSTFGRLVGRAAGIPTVIHDFDTQIYFPYPLYLKVLDRLLAPATGRALAASPLTRDYMRDVRRVPEDRIDLMTHAVPGASFVRPTAEEAARLRGSLGWGGGEVVFAVATKLGPDRGNEFLLRAFSRAFAERPRARLVVIYKPTRYHRVPEEYGHIRGIRDTAGMRKSLDDLIAELKIGARVELVESLDQPEDYFRACDAVVVPFLHPRFSSVNLLEAFACGRPAIATALGEQGILVEHGTNGLLVPPGDEGALAAALERMADDGEGRRRMGDAAAETAARHSIRSAADRLSEMYESLAAARRTD